MLTIRKRRPTLDDPIIIRLIREQLMPHSFTASKETLAQIRERMKQGTIEVIVVRAGNPPLGFVQYHRTGTVLNVDLLAIEPHVQGRGLGQHLLHHVETVGRNNGAIHARVFVDDSNKQANYFYQKNYYTTIRTYAALHLTEMIKSL